MLRSGLNGYDDYGLNLINQSTALNDKFVHSVSTSHARKKATFQKDGAQPKENGQGHDIEVN